MKSITSIITNDSALKKRERQIIVEAGKKRQERQIAEKGWMGEKKMHQSIGKEER